uniref:GPN-loop GTPase 3 n=1 Tax=Dermatophagoides pteronyssinus TaxID=6956 RepID=A0A6P6YB23_DERPT|nr:GPN-loop GTPase 3-like [Dermatophagoides pteronyssinus]
MKYAQLYIGVAGSGKSSCCKYVQEHLNLLQRKCYVVNWDVASENLPYEAYADVRDVIDIKAYQSDNFLGPNGALIEAMESISTEYDYLSDVFEDIEDSSFVLLDCPGQLELYSNSMAIFNLIKRLIQFDYSVICIFCMDIAFLSDLNKLLGSAIYALSSMVLLDAPFVCALTKWDLLDESSEYNQEDFSVNFQDLISITPGKLSLKQKKYITAIQETLNDWNMLSFNKLSIVDDNLMSEFQIKCDLIHNYEPANNNYLYETRDDNDSS